MSKQIKALKIARVALTEALNARVALWRNGCDCGKEHTCNPLEDDIAKGCNDAINNINEALAEAEKQEPVAWMEEYQSCKVNEDERLCHSDKVFRLVQLLASQSKELQSLSDDEKLHGYKAQHFDGLEDAFMCGVQFAEVTLKERNNGL